MRWLLRGAIGLAGLGILVVVGAIVAVSTTDFSAYRDEIAAAVKDATGREIRIGGRIEQTVLSLSPSIAMTDISFANAVWGSRPQMMTAQRAEIEVALFPLIGGAIEIKRFSLTGANLLLETNEKGAANWLFGKQGDTASGKASGKGGDPVAAAEPAIPFVGKLQISDSVVTFRDGRSGLVSKVRIEEAGARAPAFDSAIAFEARGAYNGVPAAAEGMLGGLGDLFRRVAKYPATARMRLGKSRLQVTVEADLSGALPDIVGSVDAALIDLDEIAAATARGANGKKAARKAKSPDLFPRDELPLGIFGLFNARAKVSLKRLVVAGNAVDAVRAAVVLQDGRMAIRKFSSRLAKGRVAGTLRLDVSSRMPKVVADLRATGIAAGEVLRQAMGEPLVHAPVAVRAQVSGAGRSVHAIVSALKGPVTITVGRGPVANRLFDIATTDLLELLVQKPGELQVVCGVFALRFDGRGVGRGQRLVLDTNRMTFYGKGAVDLPREALDFRFVPAGKGVSLTQFASILPVRITGPLTRPEVAIEATAIPKRVVSELLGLVTRPFEKESDKSAATRGCGARKAQATAGPKDKPRVKRKSGARKLLDDLRKINPFRE